MTIAKTRRIDSRRTEVVRFGNEGMLGRVPGEKGKIRPLKEQPANPVQGPNYAAKEPQERTARTI
jgi:hypothetical protein